MENNLDESDTLKAVIYEILFDELVCYLADIVLWD